MRFGKRLPSPWLALAMMFLSACDRGGSHDDGPRDDDAQGRAFTWDQELIMENLPWDAPSPIPGDFTRGFQRSFTWDNASSSSYAVGKAVAVTSGPCPVGAHALAFRLRALDSVLDRATQAYSVTTEVLPFEAFPGSVPPGKYRLTIAAAGKGECHVTGVAFSLRKTSVENPSLPPAPVEPAPSLAEMTEFDATWVGSWTGHVPVGNCGSDAPGTCGYDFMTITAIASGKADVSQGYCIDPCPFTRTYSLQWGGASIQTLSRPGGRNWMVITGKPYGSGTARSLWCRYDWVRTDPAALPAKVRLGCQPPQEGEGTFPASVDAAQKAWTLNK